MTGVMSFDAFGKQAFTAAASPAREDGAAALGSHACAKTMLALACSLGWLISAFHKTDNRSGAI